jgi:hypothetical protein
MERVLEQEVLAGDLVAEWRDHLVDLLLHGVSSATPEKAKPKPPSARSIRDHLFGEETSAQTRGPG